MRYVVMLLKSVAGSAITLKSDACAVAHAIIVARTSIICLRICYPSLIKSSFESA
jgi:hypothetical protein